MSDSPSQAPRAGDVRDETDAWGRFCDELKEAGRVLSRDTTPHDELTRAEGYRHLVRLIRDGFDMTCEFGDELHPRIFPMVDATLLTEGVTPDARYHHAFIDGAATHRVTGSRGTAPLIEFSTYTGRTGLHATHELVGSLTERDLAVAGDGSFEVVLSPDEHPGNWIRTDASTKRLFIRQYAHDWRETTSATYAIRREGVTAPPLPLRLERVRRALERTASYVRRAPPFWAGISDYWASTAVNRIVPQESADERTDVTVPTGHRFACGYFRLEPDEALELRFAPVPVPYWGLCLTSYWYEPLAWEQAGSAINDRSAIRGADGSVRAVVAARDPGCPNWLDTKGHREGTMVFRWSRSREPLPVFTTRLARVDELRAEAG